MPSTPRFHYRLGANQPVHSPTAKRMAEMAEAINAETGDAFRLCSSEIPNISKITACMIKHRAQLSVGCRAVVDRGLAQGSSKIAEQ